jgi:hypothetical protein
MSTINKHLKIFSVGMILVLWASFLSWAQDVNGNPRRMTNSELSATFPNMTMVGKYADGMNFKETYHEDGSITYADDASVDHGRWFVRGNLFCTFYDTANGACFSVQKSGANCYEYFIQEEEDGSPSGDLNAWNSIGWDETKPSTCDLSPKIT